MNLNWDLTNVENSDKMCWTQQEDGKFKLNDVTEFIINLTAFVGINQISKNNCKDFVRRAYILKHVGFPVPDKVTPAIIESHVGLQTSASTMDYRSFKNKVFDSLEEAVVTQLKAAA